MDRILTVEVADENASNVRYRAAFRMRDIEPDLDSITGRIPGHVMRLAAALHAIGCPGTCNVFEIEGRIGGDAIDIIGEIALRDDGKIEWKPSGGSVEGPIVADMEPSAVA